jgi:hypothetical protein
MEGIDGPYLMSNIKRSQEAVKSGDASPDTSGGDAGSTGSSSAAVTKTAAVTE